MKTRQSRGRRRQFAQGIKRDALHSVLHRHRARDRFSARCRSHSPVCRNQSASVWPVVRSSSRSSSAASGTSARQVWHMPTNTNLAFREFGIALFFAAVGLGAGAKFFATVFSATGLSLAARRILRHGCADPAHRHFCARGLENKFHGPERLIAGSMTDPPALAFACNIAGSDAPTVGYATVIRSRRCCAFSPHRYSRFFFSDRPSGTQQEN